MKTLLKFKIIFIILFILLIIKYFNTTSILGFQNHNIRWSPDLIKRFNIYQTTVNQNANQYNLERLQSQATSEEAEVYLKTGFWPWTENIKKLYVEQVIRNPIIKIEPGVALNNAMKIYNQNAIIELLAWNTKEGHFLLYGSDLGVTSGMPKNIHNTLKCVSNSLNDTAMVKTIYTGMNEWNGYMNKTSKTVIPEDIPNVMPGFSFIKSPCNPCKALNVRGDFSCPFKINVEGDDEISEPWKILWHL